MNSRIVYPAPSFQPPETCTEHRECQQGQASNADLCRMTLEHYEKVSRAAHEWNSAIPKAIALYYADPERARLEREVVDASLRFRRATIAVDAYWQQQAEKDEAAGEELYPLAQALTDARNEWTTKTDALIDFESSQIKK